MNLFFLVKEGFSGIWRAKLPSAVTVISGFFALVLLGVFSTVSVSFFDLIDEVRGRVELEIFFDDRTSQDEVQKVVESVGAMQGVREVDFLSKDDAAKIFEQEFGQDIVGILGVNPLPRSMKLRVEPLYASPDSLQMVASSIGELQQGLDIRYNKVFLRQLEENARLFTWGTAATGILISIATVILVGYTIRLAIYSRQERIKTMRLVGATNWFISAPYLIEGGVQGILSGVLAALAIYLMFEQGLQRYEPGIYAVLHPSSLMVYPLLAGLGFILGVFGSTVSVSKYLRKP